MMSTWQRQLTIVLVIAASVALACSPEAGRTRGGGPGADVGNRGGTVQMHGDRGPGQVYYQTPRVGQRLEAQR
jgi:hypothetical protein